MNHPIQCDCGQLQGRVDTTTSFNHCICYCTDCQAFARFLAREGDILDKAGGSDIVQLPSHAVALDRGREHLACMRLTHKGLLRWYAACCNTPIGNTLPTCKLSFVGLLHNCLEHGPNPLATTFGPVRARVHTRHALCSPKPRSTGMAGGFLRIAGIMAGGRISGRYRETPFFDVASNTPVAVPKVLSPEELNTLKQAL